MTFLLTIAVLLACAGLMGLGFIISKKTLQRGCALGDDCTCKKDDRPPETCDKP